MKKLTNAFIIIIVTSAVLLLAIYQLNSQAGFSGDNTLNVYNWGDYIDPDLISQFEEETGIKVIYETFDSNEAMLMKIQQGGTHFDIAVPSEYAIAKMINHDLLHEIDHTKLPNLENIDPRFKDLDFDPGNRYSIPYFWGTVGVVYNTSLIGDKEITSWNDLWDPAFRNQIILIDGAREQMGMALNSLGYSLNETDKALLDEAKRKLDKLTPNVRAIVGDEIKMLMVNREATLAVTWSGDAMDMMEETDELDYVVPIEGSNLWFDNMVIPKGARNIEGAHKFINFMLDAENGAKNSEYVGYSTPNQAALAFMDEEMTSDKRFYPSEELTARLEVYKDLGKRNLSYYNELFLAFKMNTK